MEIHDTPNRVAATAAAGQTVFTFNFLIFDPADIAVTVDGIAATLASPALNASQYSVTILEDDEGGSITFGAGLTLGDAVIIQRDVPLERLSEFATNGPLSIKALNEQFNRALIYAQDTKTAVDGTLRFPTGETVPPLPDAVSRAGKFLGFDVDGDFVALAGTGNDAQLRLELESEGFPYGTANILAAAGESIFRTNEGASGDAHYWGRNYTGAKAVGPAPATNLAYGPVGYMFDLRKDDADAGTNFVRALYGRTVFGGPNAKGGRVGILGQVQQDAATSSTNLNRDYVGGTFQSYTFSGDGGTDLSAGAKGRYYGFNSIALAGAGCTNIFEMTGGEINTYMGTGSSSRNVWGLSICGMNSVRGSVTDAAIEIGNAIDAGYGGRSWKHGILFSDVHGLAPVEADSIILGTHWENGVPRNALHGIDLSGFILSGALIQGRASYLSEFAMQLGVNGSNLSAIYAGGGATNATLVLAAKGTGSTVLNDGGGISRVLADSGVGVRFVPLASATPTANGELAIQATSNTSLTFRFKGSDGTVRQGSVALA
jgi:hypothetical protein